MRDATAFETNVRPREAASGDLDGEPWVINPGEVFAPDHDLVRAYPHLFTPVEPTRSRPDVEQATAAPGERRGGGRGRGRKAKAPEPEPEPAGDGDGEPAGE